MAVTARAARPATALALAASAVALWGPPARAAAVVLDGGAVTPRTVEVPRSGVVTWVNAGTSARAIAPVRRGAFEPVTVAPGGRASVRLRQAGSVGYRVDGRLAGTIVVLDPVRAPPDLGGRPDPDEGVARCPARRTYRYDITIEASREARAEAGPSSGRVGELRTALRYTSTFRRAPVTVEEDCFGIVDMSFGGEPSAEVAGTVRGIALNFLDGQLAPAPAEPSVPCGFDLDPPDLAAVATLGGGGRGDVWSFTFSAVALPGQLDAVSAMLTDAYVPACPGNLYHGVTLDAAGGWPSSSIRVRGVEFAAPSGSFPGVVARGPDRGAEALVARLSAGRSFVLRTGVRRYAAATSEGRLTVVESVTIRFRRRSA
jgi:hypothetical protein